MKTLTFRIGCKSRFERAMRNQFRCEPPRLVYFLLRHVVHGSSDQSGLRTLGGHASQYSLQASDAFQAMVGSELIRFVRTVPCVKISAAAGTLRTLDQKWEAAQRETSTSVESSVTGLDGRYGATGESSINQRIERTVDLNRLRRQQLAAIFSR
jgi:hypothetical protein